MVFFSLPLRHTPSVAIQPSRYILSACIPLGVYAFASRQEEQYFVCLQDRPCKCIRGHQCRSLLLLRVWMIRICHISLAAAHYFGSTVIATPQLLFPINSQVPPVAISSEPYIFSFSANTFWSSSDISYSLSSEPTWLKIDSSTHTFTGIPRSEDIGDIIFELRASDADGETSCSVTLVVRSKAEVQVGNLAILPQLAGAGSVSAPTTLLLHPAEEFSFAFAKNTFIGVLDRTSYYAISTDSSPIPSWIHFDAYELSFSGITPPNLSKVATWEEYNFDLIASNIPGFSEATIRFQITVATHILSFKNPVRSIPVFVDEPILLSSLLDGVSRDGLSLRRSDIESVSSNLPTWLELNDKDLSLQGSAPSTPQNVSFNIDLVDIQGGKASVILNFEILGQDDVAIVSEANLGIVNATAGTFFKHVIGSSNALSRLLNIDVELGVASPWLSFDPNDMSIQGHIPLQPTPVTTKILFEFSRGRTLLQRAELQIAIVSDISMINGTTTLPSTFLATATTSTTSHNKSTNFTRKQIVTLVLGIVLPLVAVVILVIVIFALLRKRRRKALKRQGKRPQRHSQMINNPAEIGFSNVFQPSPAYGNSNANGKDNAALSIEPSWAPDSIRRTKNRTSRQERMKIPNIISSSSQPNRNALSDFSQPVLTDLAARSSVDDHKMPKRHRNGSRSSKDATLATSPRSHSVLKRHVLAPFPNTQRFSKAQKASVRLNHLAKEGTGTRPPSPVTQHISSINQRDSWQTTSDSTQEVSGHSSLIAFNDFPLPPQSTSNGINMASSPQHEEDIPSSPSSQSFEARRQNFHTQRARDKLEGVARFSNAGTSRSDMLAFNEDSIARMLSFRSQDSLVSRATGESIIETFYPQSRQAQQHQQRGSSYKVACAKSPESQWVGHSAEMKDLSLEDHGEGGRGYESRAGLNYGNSKSARLQFDAENEKDEWLTETEGNSHARLRFSGQRKRVSMGSSESNTSKGSYRGSFRFI